MLSLVKEAADLGVREIRIPGSGEPLLKDGILEIMSEIKKHDMHGMLITNGTLFDEDRVAHLVRIGWDVITISIDSPVKETNDRLRGKGAFEKARRSICWFNDEKKREGREKPFLRINMVLTNENFSQLEEMIGFAVENNIGDVQVQPMTVWGDEGRPLELNDRQRDGLQDEVKRASKLARPNNIFTNIDSFLDSDIVEKAAGSMDKKLLEDKKNLGEADPFLKLPCYEPFYNMIILPDGKIAACSISGGVDGDSIADKSLEEVWLGTAFSDLRQSLLSNQLKSYCKKCCSAVYLENYKIKKTLENHLSKEGATR